jgi:hypothetical protein
MTFKNHLNWIVHTLNNEYEFVRVPMTIADSVIDFCKFNIDNIEYHYFSKNYKAAFSYCPHGNGIGALCIDKWSLLLCSDCFKILKYDPRTAQIIYNVMIHDRIDKLLNLNNESLKINIGYYNRLYHEYIEDTDYYKLFRRITKYNEDPIEKYELLHCENPLLTKLLELCD